MKRILLLVLGFGALYSVSAVDVLLKNGDFSATNSKGRPRDWSVARFISSATIKNKQLIVKVDSVQKMQGYISQTVKLQANRIYRLTGEIKSSQRGTAFLQVKANQKRYSAYPEGGNWQKVDITFSTGNSSKATILCRLNFSKNNQGAIGCFKKLLLVDTGLSGSKVPKPSENFLPNSSFEMGRDARQNYAFIGDSRQNMKAKWQIVNDCAYDGKQSLLMSGRSAYVWNVLSRSSNECVFSVYLKSSHNTQVELGVEPIYLHTQGAIFLRTVKKSFNISQKWKRYEVAFKLKKKLTGYSQRQLYRVWIKPVSSTKIWADAAQLETGQTASTYSAARSSNKKPFMNSVKVEGPASLPQWRNKQPRTGKVQLSITKPNSCLFKKFPVSAGIPFPLGELFDPAAVKLVDHAGVNVPMQSMALARRHTDGSIISLLLDFQADANNTYTLYYGDKIISESKLENLVVMRNNKFIIDTGTVQAVIDGKKFRGFSRITNKQNGKTIMGPDSGCFVITPDDKRYSSRHSRGKVTIERNGPLHAIIRADGRHRSADGHEMLRYITRIHAYAGKPYFLIETTFENRERQLNTLIKGIGLELPLPKIEKVVCHLTGGVSKVISTGEDGVEITQLHEAYGSGKYELIINDGNRKVIENSKATGIFSAGNATFAVKDFWRLNPRAVKFNKNKASIYLWPEMETKYVDLPFGFASTMSIAYAPFGNAREAVMLVDKTPLLQASPEWMSNSRVFGNFLTPAEARLNYPRYHQFLKPVLNRIKQFSAITDLTGTSQYGEFGGSTKRLNNESVISMNLWLQYVRSGDQKIFDLARAVTLHQREVDVCHAGDGACFMHTHSALVNTSYMFHTGHFWITGLIWHYLLTGDMRSYNVARDLGANLLLKYRLSHYKGRERARMLLHLAELYELTHFECFRHAYETHYNYGKPTPTGGDYYIGIGLLCLKKWYDVTGEKKYLKRFIRDAREILEIRKHSKYGKTSFDSPDYSVGSGRDWYLFQAMAEAAEVTGDKEFITIYYDWMVTYMIHPMGSSINAVQGSYFLKAANKLGIEENPMTPQHLLGIAGMTGCFCSRLKIIISPGKKAETLNIYRVRPFRYWKNIKSKGEDQIKFKVISPEGRNDIAGTLSGPKPLLDKKIELSPVTKNKSYQLELNFKNDAWGAVSTSAENVSISTDQYFAARTAPLTSRIFEFIVTPAEQLKISLRWRNKNKTTPMGKTFGVMLQDLNGITIASKRWTVPVGTCFNMSGGVMKDIIDKLIFPIPFKYQGKSVKLIVAAPKATRWRFSDLKSPFLNLKLLKPASNK